MKYVAAFALAYLSGNANPSAADIEEILAATGSDIDKSRITEMLNSMQGVNVSQAISAKLATLASFGGAGAGVAAAAAPAAAGEEAAAEDAGKKKEEEEEEEEDFGFDLFG
jgi:ribosomal protein L12E/L44/L45/RPP1/RPP2